ncbi:PSD1 and planctomycete cytochrome C domain-containing protein [Allorhodopirellula heiligendammensis]|uniref:Planctomycete cytochrome C n=1 Tax=Allorhodopirellula heiligendammensis TaxID=2714739 RepID=A0A5C6BFE6_9BACT|nr:PSD1 and planctomycete cytochrome C domain-containing protein [Allorhodopirellula heiligendammensis]TWU10758.1 Planctomycete cytochrome C [Allorhodopirellula heiligendammensis]
MQSGPLGRAIVLACALIAPPTWAETAAVDEAYFETHVRPLLIEHCYECHSQSAGESMGDLHLDTAAAMASGGVSGPVVIPGNAAESLLIKAMLYADADLQMPPEGKLADEQIERLRTWIDGGAPDPRDEDMSEAQQMASKPLDRDPSTHWAFVPPQRLSGDDFDSLPDVLPSNADAADADPIDEIARGQAAVKHLSPAPAVNRATLHRRWSDDLHGLPVSSAQIASFESDSRPDAETRRIDRMLADPRFGERFTRHWLDVARYADTIGYAVGGKDRNLKYAYRYRDWLISAFCEDMPYDEMIRHQLAGDQTAEPGSMDADAMGFLTVGRQFLRHDDTIDDRIDVVTRGLLGLTVSCARCHDHKFDPIPTIDYYSLYNVLENSVPPADLETAASPLMLVDRPKVRDFRVFVRGDRSRQGEIAPRRYLTAFRKPETAQFKSGSGRLELAEAIVDPANPLTARVMVNRIWEHLLGHPLVDSPSDFGYRTPAPPLQSVLDELAADFASDWSIKRLVRRILHTRIYHQAATPSELARVSDPENALWTHARRSRLDFESMRDGLLMGCGYLDNRIGGPAVEITQPDLVPRRTLYARIDRQNLPGLFRTFDFASPDMHSPGRYYTTVPQQPLFLLNHPQISHAAQLAVELARQDAAGDPDDAAVIESLFRQVLGREPPPAELADAVRFVSSPPADNPNAIDPRSTWQYGTAMWADDQVTQFTPLKVFKDDRWQFEETFPSPGPMSYASLSRDGGHPAHGDAGIIVRRWTSPANGKLTLNGAVTRPSDQDDGIIATVQVNGQTEWQASIASGTQRYNARRNDVQQGDVVDFIVHSGEGLSFDSFQWRGKLLLQSPTEMLQFSSTDGFSGPFAPERAVSLDRFEQLAQVLFLSNEFFFVD